MNKWVSNIILPVLVLAGAAFGARTMTANSEVAQATEPTQRQQEVTVLWLTTDSHSPAVEVNGVAEATRTMNLTPQVEGQLVYVSPDLVEGSRVKAGSLLVRIDQSSHKIALAQAEAELARAGAELELEAGRAQTATKEWQQFGAKGAKEAGQLARRAPQFASAQALVALRRAQVDKVKLDLSRTSIRAPFNAIVQSEQVEKGQVVSRNSKLCTLIASDEVWVRAPVDLQSLSLLHASSNVADLAGSPMDLRVQSASGKQATFTGTVLRLASAVDTATRKAELLVQVPNVAGHAPLLPGTFVTGNLRAKRSQSALAIPRSALVDGTRFWVVSPASKLVRILPQILWTDQDFVYVDPTPLKAFLKQEHLAILRFALAGALQGTSVTVTNPAVERAYE